MENLLVALRFINIILIAMYLYMSLLPILGFFKTKRFAPAKEKHRYGILIAARNEENVIGELLDSIHAQTYPQDKMTVFVVADNCEDDTVFMARSKGAVCYERFDDEHCTKGYAIEFLMEQIERDYGITSFDGFLMLDADNLLSTDYIEKMNDAFASGEKIITSYRNSKNLTANCISASYALHWMRTARCENRAKSLLGLSCRIQGTGFLFASELVKDGWHYTNLTEDRAFGAAVVTKGYRISYQDEAVFYDDQPEQLHIAYRQRKRWAKGHLQSFHELGPGLIKQIFVGKGIQNRFAAYDMFTIVFPRALVLLVVNSLSALLCAGIALNRGISIELLESVIITGLLSICETWILNVATAIYVLLTERRHLPDMSPIKKLWFSITFPLFDVMGSLTYCTALFAKVEWKPIPHKPLSYKIQL